MTAAVNVWTAVIRPRYRANNADVDNLQEKNHQVFAASGHCLSNEFMIWVCLRADDTQVENDKASALNKGSTFDDREMENHGLCKAENEWSAHLAELHE